MQFSGQGGPGSGPPGYGGGPQPADIGVRLGARIIDGILLGIVQGVLITPIIVAVAFSNIDRGFGNPFFTGASASGFVIGLVSAAISIGYFTYLESNKGWTLGKKLLNLEVRGPDGNFPSMEVAFRRNAWLLLSVVPVLGGVAQFVAVIAILITVNNSPTKQGWHDEFAGGTQVLQVR